MIGQPRRDWRWLAASAALHVLGIALLVRIAVVPGTLLSWFHETPSRVDARREKLTYLQTVRPRGDSTRVQVDGGDGRKAAPNVATAPVLRAPVTVPSTLPPAAKVPAPTQDQGGSGPLVGGGGVLRGVQPSYGDGRVWPAPGALVTAPKSEDERRDSLLSSRLQRYRDSLNVAGNSELGPDARPSWIYKGRHGSEWGMDQHTIKLGKFSLPSALLYQLPLAKYQGDISRDREANLRAADMSYAVRRGLTEEQFRAAVKAIRERKERERREAEGQKKEQSPPQTPVAQGTR